MTDVALRWQVFGADLSVKNNDLETDDGLETAVIVSLFTDRRIEATDIIPDGSDDRRGWWGDSFPAITGDLIGSRLWLLSREKQLPIVLTRAEEYTREALQWLLDDRVSDRVDVTVEFVQRGFLGILVVVYRPTKDPAQFRYDYNWAGQALRSS